MNNQPHGFGQDDIAPEARAEAQRLMARWCSFQGTVWTPGSPDTFLGIPIKLCDDLPRTSFRYVTDKQEYRFVPEIRAIVYPEGDTEPWTVVRCHYE